MAKKESPAPKATPPKAQELAFPWWLPPVLYGAVTLLLFRVFVFSGEMLFGSDTLSLGYMARAFFAEKLREGVFPLWNPIILGGTPFLDALSGGDSLYPTSLLLLVMEPYRALGWKLVLHVFLAGLFTYGWIRALGRSRSAALLAGLAYLLAPHMVTLVLPGHDGKLFVSALTPLLFWATERALTRGEVRFLAGMALTITLVLLTTHFQQAYFLFGAVGIYALVRVILLWRGGASPALAGSRFALFLGFSLLGVGGAGIQLLPAVEYVTEFSRRTATTTRATEAEGVSYSSSWSLHPEELVSMVVPEFAGNDAGGGGWTEDTYWGRNGFKNNHEYAGLVVLLLAGIAFLGAPSRGLRFTFLGIGSIALLYALGQHTPVWRLFYEVVPGISLFRVPSITAFLFGFSAVTLMAFGVDWVLGYAPEASEPGGDAGERSGADQAEFPLRRAVLGLGTAVTLLVLGGVLASTGALTDAWVSLLYRDIQPYQAEALQRAQPFLAQGFLLAAVLAGGVLALVWGRGTGRIPAALWVGGIGLLVVVDQARVDDRFIESFDFRAWAAADPNIRYLQEQQETEPPFRLLSMGGSQPGQDVKPGMYDLELAGGHHPNDLARYRELIGMVGSGAPVNFFDPGSGEPNLELLALVNVRYVLWPVYRFGGFPAGEIVMATTLGDGRPYEAVYEIPTLPRARLVGEAVVVPDEEAVSFILSPAFRPERQVVLVEEPPMPLPGVPVEGAVEWVERGVNRMLLRVESDAPALLVVADNWYPAWKARVGGEEAPVLRANHTFRAVPVPRGSSEVELYYDAGSLGGALSVSAVSLLILGALLVWGLLVRKREQGARERP